MLHILGYISYFGCKIILYLTGVYIMRIDIFKCYVYFQGWTFLYYFLIFLQDCLPGI